MTMEGKPEPAFDVVEKVFMSLLNNFTAEDLRYAIKREVSLAQLAMNVQPTVVPLARGFMPYFASGAREHFSSDNTMKWLEYARPDLAEVIKEAKVNKVWLSNQVKEVKEILW